MSNVQPSAKIDRDDNGVQPSLLEMASPNIDNDRIEKLNKFCSRHEIASLAIEFYQLEEYSLICVCDDSGSMITPDVLSHPGMSLVKYTKI